MRRALSSDALNPHHFAVENASDIRNINIQNHSTISRKSYNSLSTQTEADLNSTHTLLNQHIVDNVNTEETHTIPIILVKTKELTVPFLIDTGSSISISLKIILKMSNICYIRNICLRKLTYLRLISCISSVCIQNRSIFSQLSFLRH